MMSRASIVLLTVFFEEGEEFFDDGFFDWTFEAGFFRGVDRLEVVAGFGDDVESLFAVRSRF